MNPYEITISVATLIGFFNGFQLLMFGLVCSVDYERRYQCSKKLGDLVAYPGLSMNNLFKNGGSSRIFIDLQKRINVFSWMNIRNELFIIEEEIWELKLAGKGDERINDLLSAKALLQQVDESINYKELIYKPTTILGYAANNGVIGSVLGLVLTGCLFAVQGFVSTGMEYDAAGWFNF